MAEITALMVKTLREKTDAPMMECKKALVEAEGDLEKAEDILRVRLGNKAAKSSARVAAEGVVSVYVSPDARQAAMIEINCETDFVAKNDDFLAFGDQLTQMIVDRNPVDVAALSALSMDGKTVEEVRVGLSGKIGENISLRRFLRFETQGHLTYYVHNKKMGVVVEMTGGDSALAKDIAMHIVASKPLCLSSDQISADQIAREREIYTQQASESGKPAEIVAKMVEGRIGKFLAESTLLGQPFVKNPDQTIEALLKSRQATVNGFVLYTVGEGIEKQTTDFAAEVAAQAAAARS